MLLLLIITIIRIIIIIIIISATMCNTSCPSSRLVRSGCLSSVFSQKASLFPLTQTKYESYKCIYVCIRWRKTNATSPLCTVTWFAKKHTTFLDWGNCFNVWTNERKKKVLLDLELPVTQSILWLFANLFYSLGLAVPYTKLHCLKVLGLWKLGMLML